MAILVSGLIAIFLLEFKIVVSNLEREEVNTTLLVIVSSIFVFAVVYLWNEILDALMQDKELNE